VASEEQLVLLLSTP